MKYIRQITIVLCLFCLCMYPAAADEPAEENINGTPGLDLEGAFGAIFGFLNITGNESGLMDTAAPGEDLFSTVENIQLVIYTEPEVDGNIGDYIRQNLNNSVIEESIGDVSEMKRDIYIMLSEQSPQSYGYTTDGFEVKVLPLIVDEDLGDPAYLSRNKGIKIEIFAENIQEPAGRTLGAFESYATDIVKNLYQSPYAGDIGFVNIAFSDLGTGEEILSVTLDADTAGEYEESWEESGTYIGSGGWSDISVNPDYNLVLYEDTAKKIRSGPAADSTDTSNRVIAYDDYFVKYMSESYAEIIEKIDKTGEYTEKWDSAGMLSSSKDLCESVFDVRSTAGRIPVSADLSEKKSAYLDALDKVSDAASDYWYFATYYDSDALGRAVAASDAGIAAMNAVVDGAGVAVVDAGNIDKPVDKNVLDARNLHDTFHYRDTSGCNDVSLKIDDWSIRNNLVSKDVYSGDVSTISSQYNTEFLVVSTVFTHMGYRGGGVENVATPDLSSFTLYYNGKEYKPTALEDYLQNSGMPYVKKNLERTESYDSVLVFETDSETGDPFDGDSGYLSVDLGDAGVQTWNLGK